MATLLEKGSANNLSEEMRTYAAHKDELLATSEGKYVLIKGDKIIGVFDTQEAALKRGYDEFATEPFLAHKISEVEMPLYFY